MYGDNHIYFLQYMLKNGCVSLDTATKAIEILHKDQNVPSLNIKTFISEINSKINKQCLKLSVVLCEVTGVEKLVILNTADDEVSKFQNTYTNAELDFFYKILDDVVTSDGRKLPHVFCLNLASSLSTPITVDKAEQIIETWKTDGYLVMKDDDVCLGPRCIAEFESLFRNKYRDYVIFCKLCSQCIFQGACCASCGKLMHVHCMMKWLDTHNTCPHCKSNWVESDNLESAYARGAQEQSSDSD